jgi:hypothetical protein
MAYTQNPGRGPMMKTGSGIPSALLMKNPTDPKSKTKDAVSGKPIPKGVTFGKTKKSTDDFGATVYSTNYSKEGTEGIDLGPDFKPTKEQTRIANERVKNSTPAISGTVKNKIYLGKSADVKSSFSEDKIIPKTFTPQKLSRIDQIKIKRFDREAKKEEVAEVKAKRRSDRIKKVLEYREKTGFTPKPQTKQEAKTASKVQKRMKRAKFWGNIGSALTPSGKSGFKPGCLTD